MPTKTVLYQRKQYNGKGSVVLVQNNQPLYETTYQFYPQSPKRPRPKGVDLLFSPTARTTETHSFADKVTNGLPIGKDVYGVQTLDSAYQQLYTNGDDPFAGPSFPMTYNRLLNDIKEEKVNLAMVCAEYRQTGDMFVSSAHRLMKLYRQLRRGNIAGLATDAKRYVSRKTYRDDWLLYRYGITPFVHDAKGIAELLDDARIRPLIKQFKLYEGSRKEVIRRVDGGISPYQLVVTRYSVARARQQAWVEYNSSILANFSQVGFLNAPQLAYELVPYSFVVDWFLNIGDYLASLDALVGVKRISITRNVSLSNFFTYKMSGMQVGGHRIARRDVRSLPSVGQLRGVTYEPSLTWKRIIDAMALLRTTKPKIR